MKTSANTLTPAALKRHLTQTPGQVPGRFLFSDKTLILPAQWSVESYAGQPLWVAASQGAIFYAGFISQAFDHTYHLTRAQKICPQLAGNDQDRTRNLTGQHFLLKGTAFQQQVWQAIYQVPPNKLTSYKQLGQWMQPTSTSYRAIGNAVGANPISGYIPCHRIIRGNGELGGYYWGAALKTAILYQELIG